ncbi:MAG: CopG family transcriptional regulator [Actinomycetota bacterium]|nr:CopG family transcriptional regulator [Actinomycetota bacterium]
MRLSRVTDELVTQEARRTHRSKGAVVESLADEALRTRRFPGIAFRGADWNRRPWVIGTALDVWEVIAASRGFDAPQEMAGQTDLSEAQVRLALAYYEEFPDEIDETIRDNERPLEQLRREFPTIDTASVE